MSTLHEPQVSTLPPESEFLSSPSSTNSFSPSETETALIREFQNADAFWRRPGFLAAVVIALAVAYGIFEVNSEAPAEIAELEVSDKATFEESQEQVAESSTEEESKPEVIVPPSSGLYANSGVANLAFAKQTIAEESEKVETKQVEAKPLETSEPVVHFAVNSAKLGKSTKAQLDTIAKRLRSNPGLKLRLEGHADERGTARYNQRLGLARAKAAKAYLVKKGIGAKRLSVVSFGKTRPAVKGTGESVWSKNRRVELKVKESIQLLSKR